jgi:hypothetical protein
MPCRSFLAAVTLAAVLAVSGLAVATEITADFAGAWSDNAAGSTAIGRLTVEPNRIEIKHFARYDVVASGSFGKGSLFKVTAVDRSEDPMGCGPTDHVTYIIIVPLPRGEGTPQQGIMVIFYGGTTAPDPATINDDVMVCGTHSFGRGG